MRHVSFAVIALFVFSPARSLAQEDMTSPEAIRQGIERWAESFNAHDAATLSLEYAEACDVQHGLKKYSSREEVREAFAEYFSKNPKVRTRIKDVTRRMLAPNMYVEDGTWEEWGHSEPVVSMKGLYSSIAVLNDGKWQFVHERAWPYPHDVPDQHASVLDAASKWWEYLEGAWEYEIDAPGIDKGTVRWTIESNGKALLGRFDEDKASGIEVSGLQVDSGSWTTSGFGSAGNHWTLKFDKATEDRCEAVHTGRLRDGTTIYGRLVAEKVDENKFVWKSECQTSKGETISMSATFSRKSN